MASLPMNLQPGEHLIMRVHRHFIFLLTKLVGVVVFGVIPVLILLALAAAAGPIAGILAVLWGVITLIAGYFIWYRFQYDEWIITNQRLIDSVKKNWFHQRMVSTDLINIEDMSVSKDGILQMLFNYGDLRCETAGHEAHFVLNGIPNPAGVLDTVDTARDAARRELGAVGAALQHP